MRSLYLVRGLSAVRRFLRSKRANGNSSDDLVREVERCKVKLAEHSRLELHVASLQIQLGRAARRNEELRSVLLRQQETYQRATEMQTALIEENRRLADLVKKKVELNTDQCSDEPDPGPPSA